MSQYSSISKAQRDKNIIQLLNLLNKSIFLNRYFDDKKKIEQVRGIFTGLSSVDNDEQGNKAVAEAMANPEKYVLKPQREGHSIYIRTVRH